MTIDAKDYSTTTGQLLSPIGTVIPLQNGPGSDQFFLTFARIGSNSHTYTEATPTAPPPVDLAPSSDIGVRLWDELNNTMANATTVPLTASGPLTTYQNVQQQLPNVIDMRSVTAANVISAAQLAVSYCQALLTSPGTYFPGLTSTQLSASASSVFTSSSAMDLIATPLIENLTGQVAGSVTLTTQPSDGVMRTEIYNLIQALEADTSGVSTQTVTMGVCTALLSSATSLIK